jgi:hypothetical protein
MTCTAKTKSGAPCQARATATGKCALHSDPNRAAELARKGRNKRYGAAEVPDTPLQIPQSAAEVKDALAKVLAEVYCGKLDPKVATSMAYIGNTLLRAIETSDLEQRLAALEART